MMNRHLRIGLALAAAACLAAAPSTRAASDYTTDPTIVPTVTPEAGGQYLYSYLVINPAGNAFSVSEFDLQVSPDANLTVVSAPAGFINTYTTGDSSITFSSTDPSTDLSSGGVGGIFSIESPIGPGPSVGNPGPSNTGAYLFRGFNADGSAEGTSSVGNQILSPVPEPSGLALAALGALTMAGYGRHLRRRRAAATA